MKEGQLHCFWCQFWEGGENDPFQGNCYGYKNTYQKSATNVCGSTHHKIQNEELLLAKIKLLQKNKTGIDYYAYINGDEWKDKSEQWKVKANRTCTLCSSTEVLQSHHLTYCRLTKEHDNDILVVCKNCHGILHEHLNGSFLDPSNLTGTPEELGHFSKVVIKYAANFIKDKHMLDATEILRKDLEEDSSLKAKKLDAKLEEFIDKNVQEISNEPIPKRF